MAYLMKRIARNVYRALCCQSPIEYAPLQIQIRKLYHCYALHCYTIANIASLNAPLHKAPALHCKVNIGANSYLTLSLPRVINYQFYLQPITPRTCDEFGFPSLMRWKMIIPPILTTSLTHFSSKRWENVLFELGSKRVKLRAFFLGRSLGPDC